MTEGLLDHFRFGMDKKPTCLVHVIIKYAKRYLRVRRSTTPSPYTSYIHTPSILYYYYSTPTLLCTIHLHAMQGTRVYRDGINKPEAYIRKKAPTGQQSLSRHRRRQSPRQQAQVMINVLERSSSRSLLVRVLSGGCCPTLSSGRNVLGILAQPSPSPLVVPAINHWFKTYKSLTVSLSLFSLSIHFFFWWEREERNFTPILPPHQPYTSSLRETLALQNMPCYAFGNRQ